MESLNNPSMISTTATTTGSTAINSVIAIEDDHSEYEDISPEIQMASNGNSPEGFLYLGEVSNLIDMIDCCKNNCFHPDRLCILFVQ